MPSDLTINKLKGTTTPAASTREQRIAASHRKAGDYAKVYPNVYDKNLPDVAEQIGILDFANKVATNEFLWNPQVRAKESDIAIRNLAAGIVGLPADMVDLLYSVAQYAPKGVSSKPLPELPGQVKALTSESLATTFGGDPTHGSFLPTQLLSPGPGEFKAAIMAGRRGASVQKLKRLDEAINQGMMEKEFDLNVAAETGWYKGKDGQPRFLISDENASFKWREKVATDPQVKEALETFRGTGVAGNINMSLEEVMDFPELFEAYPELRRLPVDIHWMVTKEGEVRLFQQNLPNTFGGLDATKEGVITRLSLHNENDVKTMESTLIHEVQHAVQTLEGFARGGTGRVLEKETLAMVQALDYERIFDYIDAGADSIDDLAQRMVIDGWPEEQIDVFIRDKNIHAYLGAANDVDNFTINSIRHDTALMKNQMANEIAWVLEYIDPGDVEKAQEFIRALLSDHGGMAKLEPLFHSAYKNLLGEAEARLAGATVGMSKEDILKTGLLDIARAPDVDTRRGMGEQLSRVQGSITGEPMKIEDLMLNSDGVVEFEPRRLRNEAKKVQRVITELESGIEKDLPTNQLMARAKQVLDDPELRPLMSQDKMDELNKVINDWMTNQDASIDYTQELIEAQEDILRDLLEKNPEINNIDIEDIIEGITEL